MLPILDPPQVEPLSARANPSPAPAGRRIAYLLSRYPAVSHSFFLNEILQLRELGFDLEVASINPPDRTANALSEREFDESAKTFYVKSVSPIRAAVSIVRTLVLRPRVFMRGLISALRLGGWNLHARLYSLFYLVEAILVGDWMTRRGCTHLHVHFSTAVATVGMLTSRAWKIPFSLSVHGPDEFHNIEAFYLAEKITDAKFVFCISDFCRSQLMRISSPQHWDKLKVIRLGVNPAVFAPTPRYEKSCDALDIVCVGRLVPAKGQQILLAAVSDLLRRGYDVRVQLVGDGEDRQQLESFAADRFMVSRIEFKGALSHEATRRVLESADVFVLASFSEGLPVALMEAMAMEIPCISTYVAGIPELIRDGIDGLLVPPSSRDALAAAMIRLIENPQLRRRFGAAGRERVLALHDLKANARILADELQQNLATSL